MDDPLNEKKGIIQSIKGLPRPLIHLAAAALEAEVLVRYYPNVAGDFSTRGLMWRLFMIHMFIQLLWNTIVFPQLLSPLRHLPRPKDWITADGMLFQSPRGKDCLRWTTETPNEGLIRIRAFDGEELCLVTSPQIYAEILVNRTYDFVKPYYARKFLSRILGWGLINAEGDMHRAQRRSLMPAFQLRNIRELYPLMWDKSVLLTDMLEKEIDATRGYPTQDEKTSLPTGDLEIGSWTSRLTLDIIGPAAMGRDFQSLQNGENLVAKNYIELLSPDFRRLLYFGLALITPPWVSENWPSPTNASIKRAMVQIREVCLDIIREKKENIADETEENKMKDILSIMLRGKDLADEVCVDQMLTFLAAGHETTANALAWVCFLLCKHPQYQVALRAELRASGLNPHQPLTSTEIETLPLLNGICNEVLRLYPTVPITLRCPTKDILLANQRIPKGTWLVISPWATNRDPKLWGADSEAFRPERWIDDVVDEKDGSRRQRPNSHGGSSTNYAMMTFLHGPRSCIGQGFAKAELRCAVAALFGRFAVRLQRPDEEIVSFGAVTPKPKNGIHLRMSTLRGWCEEP